MRIILIRILELGGGTGLVGLVISKILPKSMVIITDGDDKALSLLQRNLQDPRNQIDFNQVRATSLRWNENMQEFDEWCHRYDSRHENVVSSETLSSESMNLLQIDNEISNPNPNSDAVYFDIILAGDVLYKPELPNAFFDTVTRYLNPKTGILWLCHVPRSSVTHEVVEETARMKGFSIQTWNDKSSHDDNHPTTIGEISDEDRVHDDWKNARVYNLQRL
jgi:predicted nicotinamide N-methyase